MAAQPTEAQLAIMALEASSNAADREVESKRVAKPIEIPVQRVHQCGGACTKLVPTEPGSKVFQLKEVKCDQDGTIQDWSIHIVGFDEDAQYLSKPDEVVIPDREIGIEFRYPLGNPVTLQFKSDGGFTRKKLIWQIVASYMQIYMEEEKSINEKPVLPIDARGCMLNRNETDGKYAIWGHDLGDLWLESLHYYPDTHIVSLGIGS